MKAYGIIYKITNTLDDKVYIGQTIKSDPMKRIRVHFQKNHDSYVARAIKKHGRDNFSIEIIATCFCREGINHFETELIKQYNCIVPIGYNIQNGGSDGFEYTDEVKRKMSKAIKEYYKNNDSPMKGKKLSLERREKMSKARKGFDGGNRKSARKKWTDKKKLNGGYVQITAINIKTNEKYKFLSIEDCCMELDLVPSCVSRTLRGDQGRTQHKGYRFEKN